MTITQHQDLQTVIAMIQKKWGAKAIQKGRISQTQDQFSTGYSAIDRLLGGGVFRGGLIEIVGKPTSGMTTLALKLAASAQKLGDGVVYLDLASAFDPDSATHYGVNLAEIMVIRHTFEATVELLYDIITTDIPGLIIFNSLPHLSSQQQLLLGQVINRAMPRLTRSHCALLLLTLAASKRSSVSQFADIRLHTAFERWLMTDGQIQGYQTVVTLLKYKGGSEGRKVPLQLMFDDKMSGDNS
ncbi:MAG: hypothetical protein LCI00_05660 [Chloroflexi bacterium]|nr:hypothetical protein [Chloroflexota bacterium]